MNEQKPIRIAYRVAVLATVALLMLPLQPFASGSSPDASSDGVAIHAKGIQKYQVVSFDAPTLRQMMVNVEAGRTITLNYNSVAYPLLLHVNQMFSPEVLAEKPNIRPYAGTVVGLATSSVRLTINLDENTLHSMLVLPTGITYNTEPVYDGKGPLHVSYESSDVIIPAGRTGSVPQPDDAGTRPSDPNATPRPTSSFSPPDPIAPVYGTVNGTQTSVSPDIATGVYNSLRYHVYYDSGSDPRYLINGMDDHPWTLEEGIKIYVTAITPVSTAGYPTEICPGTAPFLARFKSDHQLGGTEPNVDDKAVLFTTSSAIPSGLLGCAYQSATGTHNWVWYAGSDVQKRIVADQELGHNFNAVHDCTKLPNNRYSIMCGSYQGDSVTDESFLTTTTNTITPNGNLLPRKANVWSGSDTPAGLDGVTLTWWEVRYPRNPTGGSVLGLVRTWTDSSTITLPSVFIGARNCGTDTCNKDFGFAGPETVGPGLYPTLQWTYTLPAGAATWHFWPAYSYNGHYGPYKWKEVVLSVS